MEVSELEETAAAMQGSAEPSSDFSMEEFPEDEVDSKDSKDTTSEGLFLGQDMQGIDWQNVLVLPVAPVMPISSKEIRAAYRRNRLEQLQQRMYFNALDATSQQYKDLVKMRSSFPRKDAHFFDFVRNYRSAHSKVVHFQLRNLVWATSRNDIFLVNDSLVNHWSPVTQETTNILNLSGGPYNTAVPGGLGSVQITTLCVKEHFVAAGGFSGELVCKRLDQPHLAFCGRIANMENGITNGIEIPTTQRLGHCLITSNNDKAVRIFDLETFKPKSTFSFDWAVNYSTVNPVRCDVIAVVGDDTATLLMDPLSGAPVASLKGHLDYSFAVAWHPEGNLLATGNQDTTTIVWDVRHTKSPVETIPGVVGAIRSTRFSPDGRFLAVSEATDFVHVYDVKSGFRHAQTIDLFGEVSGISFTPEGEGLFVGIADEDYPSLASFTRRRGMEDMIGRGGRSWGSEGIWS